MLDEDCYGMDSFIEKQKTAIQKVDPQHRTFEEIKELI